MTPSSPALVEADREQDRLCRMAMDLAGLGVGLLDTRDGVWSLSAEAGRLFGLEGEVRIGLERWRALVDPLDLPDLDFAVEEASAGATVATRPLRLARQPRWIAARLSPRSSGGDVDVLAVFEDASDRRHQEERRRELVHELQHRIKTILAIVRSLARRTVAGSDTVETYFARFDGRLAALAHVQMALARSADGHVDLEDLLRQELLQTAGVRHSAASLGGPAVSLAGKAAEIMALAVHELAANAIQHGCFADDPECLTVTWTLSGADPQMFEFQWVEHNPGAEGRPSPGFGLKFLEDGLAYELDARTLAEFTSDGFRFALAAPLPSAA